MMPMKQLRQGSRVTLYFDPGPAYRIRKRVAEVVKRWLRAMPYDFQPYLPIDGATHQRLTKESFELGREYERTQAAKKPE